VNTSADDCKISLQYYKDINLLRDALAVCKTAGHKTKAAYIVRRIKQLEEAV
jgi:hypothetical protein